tara:strand:+ start:1158 stop:1301 length:144 start_codon:yes stop_codon:yes gene_type:complete
MMSVSEIVLYPFVCCILGVGKNLWSIARELAVFANMTGTADVDPASI